MLSWGVGRGGVWCLLVIKGFVEGVIGKEGMLEMLHFVVKQDVTVNALL